MSDNCQCQLCGRELKGAIELKSTDVDDFVYIVSCDTPDCNWSRCRGCKTILCKKCDRERPYYCCEEGRIVSRERAEIAFAKRNAEQVNNPPSPTGLPASGN